jgi:hypothetical protein
MPVPAERPVAPAAHRAAGLAARRPGSPATTTVSASRAAVLATTRRRKPAP